ncbi:hypothetical protein Hanom_Chr02g00143301 [Helianthus anomalus]
MMSTCKYCVQVFVKLSGLCRILIILVGPTNTTNLTPFSNSTKDSKKKPP